MKEKIKLLSSLPLFAGVEEDKLNVMLTDGSCEKSFRRDEVIESGENGENRLCVILSGSAVVYSSDSERQVVLRTLGRGNMFGVASLFGGSEDLISRVKAKSPCTVLFIQETALGRLFESSSRAMYNYIGYLTGRIRFLTGRIACFTAGSAERRLALYISSLCSEANSNEITLDVPAVTLSDILNIGRASLYRAFEKLESDGLIIKKGKFLTITDRELLNTKYN